MLKTKEEVKSWLDSYEIEKYTINDDLSVDVKGSVHLDGKKLKEIPVQFGSVEGFFYCGSNFLTSLKGSPYFVGRGFSCIMNNLTSLEYCPRIIKGGINCSNNPIESLKEFDSEITHNFYHSYDLEKSSPIEVLVPYYKDKNFREMEVSLSKAELTAILSHQALTEILPTKTETPVKKSKI